MAGEQRGRGGSFPQQFGHCRRLALVGLGTRADLLPGFVEMDAHAADAGVRQQEAGELVVVVRHGVRHGDNARGAVNTINGGAWQ